MTLTEIEPRVSPVGLHALSFDLEEWYHAETLRQSGLAFERVSQAVPATIPILDLLQGYNVQATFFTVGELAEAHPYLIERLLRDGHELAFHGWTHKPLWELSPENFGAEIEQFFQWRDTNFPGVKVLGYRAPTFSLDERTAWAIRTLAEHGFVYDSSIFPAKTPLYGVPGAPLTAYTICEENLHGCSEGKLLEVPMSVFPIGKIRLGFTGGLYLRALPWLLVKRLIQQSGQQGRPAVIYIHPWEAYAPTPRQPLPLSSRLILYTGISVLPKLEKLLQTFQFAPMQKVFL
jgi:peptidoglycan-N-acetylglucosamine deacetylase